MRNLLIVQAIIVLMCTAFFSIYFQDFSASALFGGLIAVINSGIHGLRIRRMRSKLAKSPNQDVFGLVLGAIERFAFTFIAMVIGMGYLGLYPGPLLVTFGLGYVAYAISGAMQQQAVAK